MTCLVAALLLLTLVGSVYLMAERTKRKRAMTRVIQASTRPPRPSLVVRRSLATQHHARVHPSAPTEFISLSDVLPAQRDRTRVMAPAD